MKVALYRVLSYIITAFLGAVAAVRFVFDLIGYSTVADDALVAKSFAEKALNLIISAPWWAPWGVLLIAMVVLMWLSWPRQQVSSGSVENRFAENAPDESQEPTSTPEQDDSRAVAEEAEAIPFADRLFVGQCYANKRELKSEGILHISFLCFNGNEERLVIQGTAGAIKLQWGEQAHDLETTDLAAPSIPLSLGIGQPRDGLSSFPFAVDQTIGRKIAEDLEEIVERKEIVYIDFSDFQVRVSPENDLLHQAILPLPKKVQIMNSNENFFISGHLMA